MKKLMILISVLLVGVLVGCSSNDETESEHEVVDKYKDHLTVVLDDSDVSLENDSILYFYSSECSYCLEFEDNIKEYAEKEDSLPIYLFDSTVEDSLEQANKYISELDLKVEGTPTLVIIRDGEVEDTLLGIQEVDNIPVKNE